MSSQSANVPELPVPLVPDAPHSTLQPTDFLGGTTVQIDFPGLSTAHSVQLFWARPGHIEEFTTQSKDASLPAEVFIPASVIGESVGKTVQIWYKASLNEEVKLSHTRHLTVEHIPPAKLPEPQLPDVVKIEGTVFLDLRRFSGNARVLLSPWVFIAPGQRIWISVVGQRNYPTHETLDLVKALEVTSEQVSNGLELTIDRSFLTRLDDKSALTLEVFVAFDKSPNIDTAHELPRWTELLLKSDTDLPAPIVEQTLYDVLNPALVPDEAMIVIKYKDMRPTDRIMPLWLGTAGEGTPELKTIDGDSSGEVKVAVSASAVAANEGETVDVSYRVLRDEIVRPSPITRVTVQKQRYVHVENFDGHEVKIVSAADEYTFTLPTMSITLLEGAGSAGIMRFGSTIVGFLEGLSFGMCINSSVITPPQHIQFEFQADYDRISFTWTYLHLKGVVEYFDANGASLGRKEYHGHSEGGALHQLIDFVAPPQTRIKSMKVICEDYSFLDFFTMCG
ncbi:MULTISPECIES: hypothetical protein [unclassified Pseudomonas]|uniref:hypothetical protein n=1 Tax=unclassified Pseudomonas TaxID=196821 RepID=UPI000A1FBBEA|nr:MULTISPECIES: hypothetical protein [unclassified Pseudomonas]